MIITLSVILIVSLGANVYQYTKKPKPTKDNLSIEAEAILHDLSRGPALIKVTRVDPSHIMLRSPR
jgi:hypothetical protein